MKPYLVHNTWIDLDHVLAISSSCHGIQCTAMNTPFAYAEISVECMFREKPVAISVGELPVRDEWVWSDADMAPAKKILDDFIAAWKARDNRTA